MRKAGVGARGDSKLEGQWCGGGGRGEDCSGWQ